MANGFFKVPQARNEEVKSYAPGSPEREEVQVALAELMGCEKELPMYIGNKKVTTGNRMMMSPPHDHQHVLGYYHQGDGQHVQMAIDAAVATQDKWSRMSWEQRAAIFLKAADLLAGPWRARVNAATMLAQSKNVFQAEIDAAAELADFFRFNVQYMTEIYAQQPLSGEQTWNRVEYRPLEGFILAITPFNFTSIAGNLPSAPALMGNTVVWKPAQTAIYTAQLIMELLLEAGLPMGVINLVYVSGSVVSDVVFKSPYLAGIHFTGSTGVFNTLWRNVADNLPLYRSYPRIVGETGGKDYIFAHPSADAIQVATAITRGAFEYQGQKCSAASRAYIPQSLWPVIEQEIGCDMKDITMGSPLDFTNFVNAVIDERAFDKLARYIDDAHKADDAQVLFGGSYDKSKGYFIEPTIILTTNPHYETMREELFGPVITLYVYEDDKLEEVLTLIDTASAYALTGALFATDRFVIDELEQKLTHTAGNFYINDKPTGAVVGQQPFGGGRASGTNDKAGSVLNLMRWVSPRTIKENFVPPVSFKYPFMQQ